MGKTHKFFNAYLYGSFTLAMILTAYTINQQEVEFGMLSLLLVVYGVVLEMIMFTYAQNKAVSLQGIMTIFALLVMSAASAVAVAIVSFVLENIVMRVVKKETVFNLDYKIIFNMTMRVLCVLISKSLYMALLETGLHMAVVIALTVVMYNIINVTMLITMIYFMTSDKNQFNKGVLEQFIIYTYIYIVFGIIIYYGYIAYGIVSLVAIFSLMAPIQTSVLNQAVSGEVKKSLFTDALTGAYNRASLNKIINEYTTIRRPFTIVFLDFNRFKLVNDTYGHDIGDRMLIDFVQKVTQKLRKDDKLYRFGGDEFALVLDNEINVNAVVSKMNSLKESMVLVTDDLEIPYTFSVGVVEYDGSGYMSIDEIINKASKTMEEDKKLMHEKDGLEGTYVDDRIS